MASHTPSDASTTQPPSGGTLSSPTLGSASTHAPQSASPIERPIARPPGHARMGPVGPFETGWMARPILPPASRTRSRSSGQDSRRWSALAASSPSVGSTRYALESPTLACVSCHVRLFTATTVSVAPAVA